MRRTQLAPDDEILVPLPHRLHGDTPGAPLPDHEDRAVPNRSARHQKERRSGRRSAGILHREKERALDTTLRSAITDAGGTPVEGKVLGDGVMAVFTSARQAIEAAVRCRDLGNEANLPLHLGINAGDVVREGNNIHGGAVQVASRVQSAAAPGEILVSATVRDLARTSAGVQFEDRGEHELKGIAEPQRLFVVREQP